MNWCRYPVTQVLIVAFVVSLGALMALFVGNILPKDVTVEENEGKSSIIVKYHQSRLVGSVDDFNWLVSISWKRYADMDNSWEFFCPGTIIHATKVLTGNGCLKDHFTMNDILGGSVRSGSSYIFKSGLTHNIIDVKNNPHLSNPYNKIMILTTSPPFNDDTNKPIILGSGGRTHCELHVDCRLISASWGGVQIPNEQVAKYEPFFIEEWVSEKLVPCLNKMCNQVTDTTGTCCVEAHMGILSQPIGPVSGKALIIVRQSGPPILIGMHISHLYQPPNRYISERDLCFLLDIAEPQFLDWLRMEVPEALYPTEDNSPPDRSGRYKLYSEIVTEEYLDDVEWFKRYNALLKYADFREKDEDNFSGSGSGSGEGKFEIGLEKEDEKKREEKNEWGENEWNKNNGKKELIYQKY